MENASKALIIAGAILLSILIIGLGVFVYNQASKAMDGVNMNEQQIQAFNQKFEAYEGTNVMGSNVRALYDTARTHNNAQEDSTRKVKITATPTDASVAITGDFALGKAKITTGSTYDVKVKYDNKTGLVNELSIKVNTNT